MVSSRSPLVLRRDEAGLDSYIPCDLSNTRMVITHELEDVQDIQGMIDRQELHLLIYGHTHKPDVKRIGGALLVNPGETGGWTTGKSTVAIVDLAKMEAKEIELK